MSVRSDCFFKFQQLRAAVKILFVSLILLFGLGGRAGAFDVDGGDYTALPAGTDLFLEYFQHADRDSMFANGRKVSGNNTLSSDVGVTRLVHYMDIGGFTVDPQILVPYGQLQAGGDLKAPLGGTAGFADPILAASVWLVNKPKENIFFAVTPAVYLPIGSYASSKPLNMGENRWKFILQGGGIFPVAEKVLVDLIGDFTAYGDNRNFPGGGVLQQRISGQFQAFMRYIVSDAWSFGVKYSILAGGETLLNNAAQNNPINQQKYGLFAAWFVRPTTQLRAEWGQDISVDNGFKESSRVNLRLLQVF